MDEFKEIENFHTNKMLEALNSTIIEKQITFNEIPLKEQYRYIKKNINISTIDAKKYIANVVKLHTDLKECKEGIIFDLNKLQPHIINQIYYIIKNKSF